MHSVPTATSIHATPRPALTDGQATPCLVKQRAASTPISSWRECSRKHDPRQIEGHQPTMNSQAKFDFPIAVIRHSPRIG